MAKLVDAPDLGSGAARRGGSSPSTRTTLTTNLQIISSSSSQPLDGCLVCDWLRKRSHGGSEDLGALRHMLCTPNSANMITT